MFSPSLYMGTRMDISTLSCPGEDGIVVSLTSKLLPGDAIKRQVLRLMRAEYLQRRRESRFLGIGPVPVSLPFQNLLIPEFAGINPC